MDGCKRCGRLDATLRGASFAYTISIIVMTFFNRSGGGIYCAPCRRKVGALYTAISVICGWWGFPWGPIRTIHAISSNSAGGRQDRQYNANLLRTVAIELLRIEDKSGAIEALQASLEQRDDGDLRRFLWQLQGDVTIAAAQPLRTSGGFRPGQIVTCTMGAIDLLSEPAEDGHRIGISADSGIVTRIETDWVEIRTPEGHTGWVPISTVECRQ